MQWSTKIPTSSYYLYTYFFCLIHAHVSGYLRTPMDIHVQFHRHSIFLKNITNEARVYPASLPLPTMTVNNPKMTSGTNGILHLRIYKKWVYRPPCHTSIAWAHIILHKPGLDRKDSVRPWWSGLTISLSFSSATTGYLTYPVLPTIERIWLAAMDGSSLKTYIVSSTLLSYDTTYCQSESVTLANVPSLNWQ